MGSTALLEKAPDYNVYRMAGQCLRCKGKSKVGHVLCRGCFFSVLGTTSEREIIELNREINGLMNPTVWQPAGVKQTLIEPTKSTGIINCGKCNRRRQGEEMSCLNCGNSLIASAGLVNCRVGEPYTEGPGPGGYCFPTQKELGPATWDLNGAPGRTIIANKKHKLERARAEGGVIYPAGEDIIAIFGREVKAFRVDGSLEREIGQLKKQRDALVEVLFFNKWFAGNLRSGVADSELAKAKINCESVDQNVVAARDGGPAN